MKIYQVLERDPGDKPPAPPPLAAVQALVNTVDLEHCVEGLTAPEALGGLLADHGLLGAEVPIGDGDVARARELREALRGLLMTKHGHGLAPAERAALDRAGRAAGLALRARADGTLALEPSADGVDGAFGRLLAIVHRATADGSWLRLKVCPGHACMWAFWDASPAASGIWCSMDVCGNRTKTRRYRRREAEEAA